MCSSCDCSRAFENEGECWIQSQLSPHAHERHNQLLVTANFPASVQNVGHSHARGAVKPFRCLDILDMRPSLARYTTSVLVKLRRASSASEQHAAADDAVDGHKRCASNECSGHAPTHGMRCNQGCSIITCGAHDGRMKRAGPSHQRHKLNRVSAEHRNAVCAGFCGIIPMTHNNKTKH